MVQHQESVLQFFLDYHVLTSRSNDWQLKIKRYTISEFPLSGTYSIQTTILQWHDTVTLCHQVASSVQDLTLFVRIYQVSCLSENICSHLAQPSQPHFASLERNLDFEVFLKVSSLEFICHLAHISDLRGDWALSAALITVGTSLFCLFRLCLVLLEDLVQKKHKLNLLQWYGFYLFVRVFPDDGKLECQSFDFRRKMVSHNRTDLSSKLAWAAGYASFALDLPIGLNKQKRDG